MQYLLLRGAGLFFCLVCRLGPLKNIPMDKIILLFLFYLVTSELKTFHKCLGNVGMALAQKLIKLELTI